MRKRRGTLDESREVGGGILVRLRRIRSVAAVFPLLITVLWVGSCGDDRCGPTGRREEDPRSAPGRLLKAFTECHEERDIKVYSELLDEDYRFGFTPEVAESLGLPADEPWWFKEQELAATANMFDSQTVKSIKFDSWISDRDTTGTGDSMAIALRLGFDFRLTVEEPGREPLLLRAGGQTRLDLVVVPDPADPDLWVIREVAETSRAGGREPLLPPGEAAVSYGGCTLGDIKSMFK
jgi:hypothetical protein